jgi:hypothetical protein
VAKSAGSEFFPNLHQWLRYSMDSGFKVAVFLTEKSVPEL